MNCDDMLDLVDLLPHEARCTIVFSPLCDCAKRRLTEALEAEMSEGD